MTKGRAKKGDSPTKVATTISNNSKKVTTDTVIIVNGKRLAPEALKALVFQWSDNVLLVELNYDVEKESTPTKEKPTVVGNSPSTEGIDIPKDTDPEVYSLEDEALLKLSAMSALRTNKKNDDDTPVSKLKVEIIDVLGEESKYETEEKELNTGNFDITEVTSMSSALNDLAVQEQKLQKDSKIIGVEEILSPRITIAGNIFHLTEKLRLFKTKE